MSTSLQMFNICKLVAVNIEKSIYNSFLIVIFKVVIFKDYLYCRLNISTHFNF